MTAVGAAVTTVGPGDFVIAPFAISCGECESCHAGLRTSCVNGGFWNDARLGAAGCQPRHRRGGPARISAHALRCVRHGLACCSPGGGHHRRHGREFGATDVVAERGDDGIGKVLDLTGGGAIKVLEAVGYLPAYSRPSASSGPVA